jgi:diguanylate cyclase (GGDEF)-like protein/PAS domain S-box-containing protein
LIEKTNELDQTPIVAGTKLSHYSTTNVLDSKLRAVLDATPFPVAIVDLEDNQITFWSQSALTLFGHTAPTAAEWYEIAYPDFGYRAEVVNRWKPFLEMAKSSRQTVNAGEYKVTCRDGSVRICELYASFLADNLIVTFNDITERKQTEIALSENQSILSSLVNNIPDVIYVKNMEGRYLLMNETGLKFLGKPSEEVIGFTDTALFPPEQAKLLIEKDTQILMKVQPDNFEEEVGAGVRKRHFLTTKGIMREGDGSISGLFGISRDITDRKQIEKELHQQKQFSDDILNSLPGIFYMLNQQGQFIRVNTQFYQVSGYSKEEIESMSVRDFFEGADKDLIVRRMQDVFERGDSFAEADFVTKSGKKIPYYFTGHRTHINDKTYLIGIGSDITESKIVKDELRFHSNILQSLTEGIILVRISDGVIFFNNPQMDHLFGYQPGELIGRYVSILNAHSDQSPEEVAEKINAELRNKGTWNGDIENITKDGKPFWCHVNISTLDHPEYGEVWVAVHEDISTRKQVEQIQAMHQLVLETTRDGFWLYDLNGYLLEVNQAYANMTGYTREELIGKNISQISAHSITPELVLARIEKAIDHGLSYFETQHRHKDGHFMDFDVSIAYIPEAKCLFSFMRDISHRKEAEKTTRIAATAFETHEAIMITDANANIIRVNQAFEDITGYSAEDVLGKNPRMLSSGHQGRDFYADMWHQLLTKGAWTGEILDRRKNGQLYPKWLTITAVKDSEAKTSEYVAIFSDITARKKAEEEIYSLAFYDALTKLPNRRFLLDRMQQALSVSARSKNYGALLFLDMDRFKTLNDTLGHDYGDLFLIEIARRLQQCVREVDTVGRIGGDEYVVLIEEINLNAEESSRKIALVAEKIRASLSSPYLIKESEYHSSPSVGVSLYHGNQETVEAILKHADMAMYQAKESGGNTVRFFDPAMQLSVETRALLEADLRHAVPAKQLLLYYQIQLDSELRPLGAEALLRWSHPVRGMVSPMQFIPIAEESLLILEIGHWVLESACKQLAIWSKNEQTQQLMLAINVSAQQFKRHDFVETVTTLINIHQINANYLKLELTETVVLEDVTNVVSKMHALKALGVRLSLDDFGTGYSSLSYLKQLPLDQIKIDQSFVRDMTTDPNDAVMVQTIINLAQNFRLNVIAEGVETQAQLNALKKYGCMAYQGYLFSKPVPIEEFEAIIKQI